MTAPWKFLRESRAPVVTSSLGQDLMFTEERRVYKPLTVHRCTEHCTPLYTGVLEIESEIGQSEG